MPGAALSAARSKSEVIVDFPSPLLPISEIRSTLITSSLASLRSRGLLPRYDAAQQSSHRETILSCVAGAWLPLEVGFAHYRACDALGLSPELQLEIGKDVSRRIHDTFLSTVAKMARGAGVTPWLLLSKGNVLQSRLYRGGGMRIVRLGNRSARVTGGNGGLAQAGAKRFRVPQPAGRAQRKPVLWPPQNHPRRELALISLPRFTQPPPRMARSAIWLAEKFAQSEHGVSG